MKTVWAFSYACGVVSGTLSEDSFTFTPSNDDITLPISSLTFFETELEAECYAISAHYKMGWLKNAIDNGVSHFDEDIKKSQELFPEFWI
jgi:hypothetical protein